MPQDQCAQIEISVAGAERALLDRDSARTPGQRLEESADALEGVARGLAALQAGLAAGLDAGLERATLLALRRRLERVALLVRQTVEFHMGIAAVGLGGEEHYTAGGSRASGRPSQRFSIEG